MEPEHAAGSAESRLAHARELSQFMRSGVVSSDPGAEAADREFNRRWKELQKPKEPKVHKTKKQSINKRRNR